MKNVEYALTKNRSQYKNIYYNKHDLDHNKQNQKYMSYSCLLL